MDISVRIGTIGVESLSQEQEIEPILRADAAPVSLVEVWVQLAPELSRMALALGIRRELVDDVLQDVWVAGQQHQPASKPAGELRRWLCRILINRCRLEHRRQGRWRRVLDALAVGWRGRNSSEGSAAASLAKERQDAVEAALNRLEEALREIVVLRYFCEFDSREIGEMLSLPDSTVRSHLRVARQQLARDLADWKDDHGN